MKFWSDDFDMDLLKLFPDLPELLGDVVDHPLWTVGHETHGRLNHPTVWNTHGAFVWTAKPNLGRDKHGWFNVSGCVSNEPEIECTWLELLRDQWPHSYAFILLPSRVLFPRAPRREFGEIMAHIRGWQPAEDIDAARTIAKSWVLQATAQLRGCLKRSNAVNTGTLDASLGEG